ncbi:unnamed protein product [Lampetra fluviatilis]
MKNDPAGDNSGALPSLPRQPQVIADNNINIINNIHNNINNIHNNINNIIIAERLGVAWGSRPLGSGYDQRRSGAAGGGGDPLKRPPGTEQHAAMCVSVWVTPSVRGAVAPRGSRAALGMRPLTEGDGEQRQEDLHIGTELLDNNNNPRCCCCCHQRDPRRRSGGGEFARASRSHHHLLVASSLGHPPRGPRSPAAGPGEQHEQVTLLEAGMQRRRGPLVTTSLPPLPAALPCHACEGFTSQPVLRSMRTPSRCTRTFKEDIELAMTYAARQTRWRRAREGRGGGCGDSPLKTPEESVGAQGGGGGGFSAVVPQRHDHKVDHEVDHESLARSRAERAPSQTDIAPATVILTPREPVAEERSRNRGRLAAQRSDASSFVPSANPTLTRQNASTTSGGHATRWRGDCETSSGRASPPAGAVTGGYQNFDRPRTFSAKNAGN